MPILFVSEWKTFNKSHSFLKSSLQKDYQGYSELHLKKKSLLKQIYFFPSQIFCQNFRVQFSYSHMTKDPIHTIILSHVWCLAVFLCKNITSLNMKILRFQQQFSTKRYGYILSEKGGIVQLPVVQSAAGKNGRERKPRLFVPLNKSRCLMKMRLQIRKLYWISNPEFSASSAWETMSKLN